MRPALHLLLTISTMGRLCAVLVCALLSGCHDYVPGDGRLVLIHMSPTVAKATVTAHLPCTLPYYCTDGSVCGTTCGGMAAPSEDMTLEEAAAAGARYWDGVGARLRVEGHLDADDAQLSPAARLDVVPDDGATGAPAGHPVAWYSTVDGKVHVILPFRLDGSRDVYNALFAHELGHAVGLEHVSCNPGDDRGDYGNVMCPDDSPPVLGPRDVDAFFARWPQHRD